MINNFENLTMSSKNHSRARLNEFAASTSCMYYQMLPSRVKEIVCRGELRRTLTYFEGNAG